MVGQALELVYQHLEPSHGSIGKIGWHSDHGNLLERPLNTTSSPPSASTACCTGPVPNDGFPT